MNDVRVPDIQVKVSVGGEPIGIIEFRQTHRAPAAWEITGAIYNADAKQAIRSCLLACLAELQSDAWEVVDFAAEGGGETNDQLQLPFER